MNECLKTLQHKNKLAIECQTNGIYITKTKQTHPTKTTTTTKNNKNKKQTKQSFCGHFVLKLDYGAGHSSEVERLLNARWVVGSILHGVVPLSYFAFQPVLHDWCNKGHDMCYPVCGMVHIKEPLLLIDKSSLCGSSGFPFSLSEWFLTMSDAI